MIPTLMISPFCLLPFSSLTNNIIASSIETDRSAQPLIHLNHCIPNLHVQQPQPLCSLLCIIIRRYAHLRFRKFLFFNNNMTRYKGSPPQ